MTGKNSKDFIKKLKLAMLESGFNQVSLAKKIGIKSNSVSQWLTGKNNPKLSTLEKVSKAVGKPVNYFFADDSTTQNIVGHHNTQTSGKELAQFENRFKLLEKEIEVLRAEQKNLSAQIELLKLKKTK